MKTKSFFHAFVILVLFFFHCAPKTPLASSDGGGQRHESTSEGIQLHDGSAREVLSEQMMASEKRPEQKLQPDKSQPTSFRFIAWGDTKSGTKVLSALSDQAVGFKPRFTLYTGDSVQFWMDGNMDKWRQAIDGKLTGATNSNGIFDITFPVRGNHEAYLSKTGFQKWMAKNHPIAQVAKRIGASHFTSMPDHENRVYSFDYGNAHFVGLDVLGGVSSLPKEQIAWLDKDLTAAEARHVQHSFLFFHGPIFCVDGHCSCKSYTDICTSSSSAKALIAVINKHTSVSATFHGHEHVYAYTYLNVKRDPLFTHPFHQFVTGSAGANIASCSKKNRFEYCMANYGFAVVDVSGPTVSVKIYKKDSTTIQKTITYTKK